MAAKVGLVVKSVGKPSVNKGQKASSSLRLLLLPSACVSIAELSSLVVLLPSLVSRLSFVRVVLRRVVMLSVDVTVTVANDERRSRRSS